MRNKSRLVNGFRHGAVSFFDAVNELTVVITPGKSNLKTHTDSGKDNEPETKNII